MSLGARIKQLRIQKNQSLQEVADAVEASKAHIWEIERGGSKNPSMALLEKLAKHFEVTVAYLVGEETNLDQAEMIAFYRDLKTLDDSDQETIRELMRRFKDKKGSS
jgi:transcriptional regulator with XRE-family HTH domain